MGLQVCGLNLDPEGRELLPHGTLDFPCAAYSEEHIDRPGDEVPWHWHEELEILYAASGSLRVQIPAEEYLLSAGDCMIVNSKILHGAWAQPRCELHSIVFSPLLLTGSKESVYAKKYLTPLTACGAFRRVLFDRTENRGEIDAFVRAFEALSQDEPGFEFTVRDKLSGICYALYLRFADSIAGGAASMGQDDLRIQKMLDFIRKRYRDPLSLTEIAKSADIGERECLRCFGRTIQISPVQYLLKYRVMRGAEALLQNPSGSVAEIAADCGFDSPSNFSKMFRRYYTCTPRQYRSMNTQKQADACRSEGSGGRAER